MDQTHKSTSGRRWMELKEAKGQCPTVYIVRVTVDQSQCMSVCLDVCLSDIRSQCCLPLLCLNHRVDGVLGFFSNRPKWDPRPLTGRRVCPFPPLVPGGTLSLAGEGPGGCPNSDEGTDTVVL
jgi:hypothetical protein